MKFITTCDMFIMFVSDGPPELCRHFVDISQNTLIFPEVPAVPVKRMIKRNFLLRMSRKYWPIDIIGRY